MKSILFSFFCAFLLTALTTEAQQFSPTTGIPCENCHPTNYTMSSSPWISDINNPGPSPTKSWNNPGFNNVLPVPPSEYSQALPANQGQNSFVTLQCSDGGSNDKVSLTVSGFDTEKFYTMRYSVLSASVYSSSAYSPFGESAKLVITTPGQVPALVKEDITNFTSSSQNKWIKRVVIFKPETSTLVFTLSGKTAGNQDGYINFSIDKYPFDCMLPADQVALIGPTTKTTIFPSDKINLLSFNTFNSTPEAAELVWKSGPNSTDPTLTTFEASDAPVSNPDPANPNNVKPYYAFYYAKDFNCYNVPVSQAEVKFLYQPKQADLLPAKTNIVLACPAITADLTACEAQPYPAGPQVRWFNNNTHSGLSVVDPKAVPPGDYYAFYYDSGWGTYSLPTGQVSTAHVHVDYAVQPGIPDLGPTMLINSLSFPPNGSKNFVVKIQNIKAENSNCSVYFKVSKLHGFNITYNTSAGTVDINGVGTINTNNDLWTFTENGGYITVTSKNGIASNGYSYIGFNVTRSANTPSGATQNLSVTIPQSGGGGETITSNNQTLTTLIAN